VRFEVGAGVIAGGYGDGVRSAGARARDVARGYRDDHYAGGSSPRRVNRSR